MNQLETIHKEWLMKTWDDYPPEWFITFRYRNQPKTIKTVESYISEFHKLFRQKFHWRIKGKVTRSSNIPMFPQGIGMVHFHEKSDDVNERTGHLVQPFHTHTHLSNTKGYFQSPNELRYFINGFIQECKKKKKQDGSRYLENFCYLNREEDVRVWNYKHHSQYNISSKKKKMKEYLVGKPELDIYSFDHLTTHF